MTPISFQTERLSCTPTQVADAPFLHQLMNTQDWKRYIGDRKIQTTTDAENYIKNKMLPQLESLGYGNYTVRLKQNHTQVGTVGLYNREGIAGVDIGFALLPEYYGKGYAFEACKQLVILAKDTWKLDTIKAITLPSNIPSQRLLERLGLEFKNHIHLPNDPDELMLYTQSLAPD